MSITDSTVVYQKTVEMVSQMPMEVHSTVPIVPSSANAAEKSCLVERLPEDWPSLSSLLERSTTLVFSEMGYPIYYEKIRTTEGALIVKRNQKDYFEIAFVDHKETLQFYVTLFFDDTGVLLEFSFFNRAVLWDLAISGFWEFLSYFMQTSSFRSIDKYLGNQYSDILEKECENIESFIKEVARNCDCVEMRQQFKHSWFIATFHDA